MTQAELTQFGKRLKELREKNNLSEKELAKAYVRKKGIVQLKSGTVEAWEKGEQKPNHTTLEILSDILCVSEDELLGTIEIKKAPQGYNQSIMKEYLNCYDGEPIWCERTINGGEYALVDISNNVIRFSDGTTLPIHKINFKIRRCPAPFSFGVDASATPITKMKIETYEKLWVEPCGGSYLLRQRLKGWYDRDFDWNGVKNASGIRFSYRDYGVTWLGYKEPIEYKEEKL